MKAEASIQCAIVEAFSILGPQHNFLAFSVPNEAFMLGIAGTGQFSPKAHALMTRLKKMGLTPGVSDLIVLHGGSAYCLEVKDADGKQSGNQVYFQNWCARTGTPYAVVRSVEEAFAQLKTWEVIQ